jgi:membrane associated rhomboid family serine protease
MASLIASFLDPVRAIIVFFVIYFLFRKFNQYGLILLATAVSAIALEAMLTASQYTRVFGYGLVHGTIASLLLSILIYYVVRYFKRKSA